MAAAVIPAGLLGTTGAVIAEGYWAHNSSAGAQGRQIAFGGSTVLSVSDTTTLGIDIRKKIQNRAAGSQIIRVAVDNGVAQSVAPSLLSIDTTAEVTVALTGSIAVATDTMVLENFLIGAAAAQRQRLTRERPVTRLRYVRNDRLPALRISLELGSPVDVSGVGVTVRVHVRVRQHDPQRKR